jgi:hypothetical protein
MLDMVVHRHQMRATLSRLLHLLCRPEPEADVVPMPQKDLEIPKPQALEGEREPGAPA